MDLYFPFKRVVKDKLQHATIIADTFHFTRIATEPLDELRLNLWRNTKSKEKIYFKNIKHALMKDISKLKDKEADNLLYAFELSSILKYAYNEEKEVYKLLRTAWSCCIYFLYCSSCIFATCLSWI